MLLRLSGSAALLIAAIALPATPASAAPVAVSAKPSVDVDTHTVPAASARDVATARRSDPRADELVADLADTRTASYSLVGVTWARGSDESKLVVKVRFRVGSRWSTWQKLEVDHDEGEGGRSGTEPLWVGKADGIGVRLINPRGTKPSSIKVVTIDPGATPTPTTSSQTSNAFYPTSTGSSTVTAATSSTPSYTSKPTIIKRSQWGASAGGTCDSPKVGETTKGIIVHHTAGSNSYAKSDSARIVRAIQAYHIKGHGWCDIGYNFLVDKYGQIFEGRKGGMDQTVRGAHAGNFDVNLYTMGVSMMGNFDKITPSAALKASMVRLIGWRIGTFYMAPKGSYTVDGITLARIAGHRNVIATACPGKYGYAWLSAKGGLRDRVSSYTSAYASLAKSYYVKAGVATTGPVFVGEYPTAGGRKTRLKNLDILALASTGAHGVASIQRTEYNRVGAQAGELGFPKTELVTTSLAFLGVQRFQGGAIYRSTESGAAKAFASWGPIAAKYVESGEWTGPLGAPRGSIYTTSDGGKRTNFQNGYISYTAATGAVVHLSA